MKIFYLAHDLDDPAILRRAAQLKRGSAKLGLAGFRRRASSPLLLEGVVVQFGETVDGRLGKRTMSILSTALRLPLWGHKACGSDVLLARGLEMLVLGALLRLTFCRRTPLVYECLDIHRLMVSRGAVGRVLRLLEGRLLRGCSLLITSSPAFIENYFLSAHTVLPPVLLWENRMLASELSQAESARRPEFHGSWRIGWFGIIRCEQSLRLLQGLCRALPGQVEVEIRGRPTKELLPKLEAAVASTPGLLFGGPYERSSDLSEIYSRVHFTWAVDFFEDGANSAWLLPNRLYEGAAHAAVPIALEWVETGRWLTRHGVGVLLGRSVEEDLVTFFGSLEAEDYQALVRNLTAVDIDNFVQPDRELLGIVQRLSNLARKGAAHHAYEKQ